MRIMQKVQELEDLDQQIKKNYVKYNKNSFDLTRKIWYNRRGQEIKI